MLLCANELNAFVRRKLTHLLLQSREIDAMIRWRVHIYSALWSEIAGRLGMTIPREQNPEPATPVVPIVQQHTEIIASERNRRLYA